MNGHMYHHITLPLPIRCCPDSDEEKKKVKIDDVPTLKRRMKRYEDKTEFKIGDIVTWKPGLEDLGNGPKHNAIMMIDELRSIDSGDKGERKNTRVACLSDRSVHFCWLDRQRLQLVDVHAFAEGDLVRFVSKPDVRGTVIRVKDGECIVAFWKNNGERTEESVSVTELVVLDE